MLIQIRQSSFLTEPAVLELEFAPKFHHIYDISLKRHKCLIYSVNTYGILLAQPKMVLVN